MQQDTEPRHTKQQQQQQKTQYGRLTLKQHAPFPPTPPPKKKNQE